MLPQIILVNQISRTFGGVPAVDSLSDLFKLVNKIDIRATIEKYVIEKYVFN